MAINAAIDFNLYFRADGTSTSFGVMLASGPFSLCSPWGGHMPTAFDVSSILPSDIVNLTSSDGTTVTASMSSILKKVTFTFASAPAAGDWQISGRFLF